MSILRKRVGIFLLSFAVIGLELCLMRLFSMRFWYHFASMIISVELLGFGSSGIIILIGKRGFFKRQRVILLLAAFSFALSIPFSIAVSQRVPLDLFYILKQLDFIVGKAGEQCDLIIKPEDCYFIIGLCIICNLLR